MPDDKAPRFLTYEAGHGTLPRDIQIIGKGGIGGKARGFIFSKLAFEDRAPEGFPRLDGTEFLDAVRFPRSYVITTEHFDEFMSENGLEDAVHAKCSQEIEVNEMNDRFFRSEMTKKLMSAIGKILGKEKGPLIVRSSSLLEDNTRHSFAGIYLSVFLTNQGTMGKKTAAFAEAIKQVYASTYNANAKAYRKKRDISWEKEKMALLVQNVIGQMHQDKLFYPAFAGVAFSKIYYRWTEKISPDDGIARLVVGLGTLAVGRSYARVFSPGMPNLSPEGMDPRTILKYSQKTFDALDISSGRFINRPLDAAVQNVHLYKVCSVLKEHNLLMDAPPLLSASDHIVPTFSPLLSSNKHMPFVPIIKNLLGGLERLFGMPIDMEFAVDFTRDRTGDDVGTFYVVQVRPLGARPEHSPVEVPTSPRGRVLIRTSQVLGNAVLEDIHHITYVPSKLYNLKRAFMIAREIGEANHLLEGTRYVLIGPGRWGSSNPQLGVPIQYYEISNASVIVEIATSTFMPEVSYGTHFFGDLTSANIIYIPVFLDKKDFLDTAFLDKAKSVMDFRFVKVIKVPKGLKVYADGNRSRSLVVMDGA